MRRLDTEQLVCDRARKLLGEAASEDRANPGGHEGPVGLPVRDSPVNRQAIPSAV